MQDYPEACTHHFSQFWQTSPENEGIQSKMN